MAYREVSRMYTQEIIRRWQAGKPGDGQRSESCLQALQGQPTP